MENEQPAAQDGLHGTFLRLMSELTGTPADPDKTFIENGGHSLIAIKLASALQEQGIGIEISSLISADSLIDAMKESVKLDSHTEPVEDQSDRFLPTPQERSLAMLESLGLAPFNPRYLVFGASRLAAGVEPHQVKSALESMVAVHPPLNTRLSFDPYGILDREELPSLGFEFNCLELETLCASASNLPIESRLSEAAIALFSDGIELGVGPALKVAILNEGNDRFLLLCFHHSVADAEGVAAVAVELDRRLAAPEDNWVAKVESSYGRLSRHNRHDAGQSHASVEYWRTVLKGLPAQEYKSYKGRAPRSSARIVTRDLPESQVRNWSEEFRTTPGSIWTSILGAALLRSGLARPTGKLLLPTFASLRTSFAKIRPLGYSLDVLPLVMPTGSDATLENSARELQQQREAWISGLKLPLPELLAGVPEAGRYFNDRKMPLLAFQVLHKAHWHGQNLQPVAMKPPSDYSGDVIPLDGLVTILIGDVTSSLSICGDESAFENSWIEAFGKDLLELLGELNENPSLFGAPINSLWEK